MNIQRRKKVVQPKVKKRELPPWVNRRNLLITAVAMATLVLLILLLREDAPQSPPPSLPRPLASASQTEQTKGSPDAAAVTGNRPPTVVSLELSPNPVYPGMTVRVVTQVNDPDDDFVTLAYEWKKNGEAIVGQINEELVTSDLAKGDLISVTVVPTDVKGAVGEAKTSRQILIHNRPPEIISAPPAGMSSGTFSYQVQASDPDNDKLVFVLEVAPAGMSINPETGLIEWAIPPGLNGKQQVRVTVTDRDAKAFQSFNLNLQSTR